MAFKDVSNKVDFVALERDVLKQWAEHDSFNELRRLRAKSEAEYGIFSFIDGPITANNPMGVHHAWGRTYKDLYQRYNAMLGTNERWQNGFDCQGLWVEVEVEKQLGFKTKRDIEAFGLARVRRSMQGARFALCGRSDRTVDTTGLLDGLERPRRAPPTGRLVGRGSRTGHHRQRPAGPVTGTVEQIVARLGPAANWAAHTSPSATRTTTRSGVSSRSATRTAGCIRATTSCPGALAAELAYSQHEIVTDGYHDVTHDSVFLRFPLDGRENEELLVWTTTPWTLTSNVAAAVGPELEYVRVQSDDGWTYYLAEGTPMKNTLIGKNNEVVGRMKGADMVGWEYSGPFDDLSPASG